MKDWIVRIAEGTSARSPLGESIESTLPTADREHEKERSWD